MNAANAAVSPEKDFDPIADDSFFEGHATEAREDAAAYARVLEHVAADGPIQMLDFGCGTGTFTARLLDQVGWPPERLDLALIEPAAAARHQAEVRLAPYTTRPLTVAATLTDELAGRFDVVLANHSLYYVAELRETLDGLTRALAAPGLLLAAAAGRSNALIAQWETAFDLLGEPIPYHTTEGVEATLRQLGMPYEKHRVPYELAFPDSRENRMRIVRFLLADQLDRFPLDPLLAAFDRHRDGDRMRIATVTDHFTVRVV